MQSTKKIFALLLALLMLASVLAGCASEQTNNDTNPETEPAASANTDVNAEPAAEKAPEKSLKIVTTIFPEYDWVHEVLGDQAENDELTMLLDNGVDLHSYALVFVYSFAILMAPLTVSSLRISLSESFVICTRPAYICEIRRSYRSHRDF